MHFGVVKYRTVLKAILDFRRAIVDYVAICLLSIACCVLPQLRLSPAVNKHITQQSCSGRKEFRKLGKHFFIDTDNFRCHVAKIK